MRMSAVPLHLHKFSNGDLAIFNEEDGLVVDCAGMSDAYARRLVDSWNACRGLSDRQLAALAEGTEKLEGIA